MRNSVRMHSEKSSVAPHRICSSAILRLVGDFERIKAAVAAANPASAPPAAPSDVERGENLLDPIGSKQCFDRRRPRRHRPGCGRLRVFGK